MRRKKGLVLLALLALAAFTITATVGGSASASSGNAVAAKKKCKKKKKQAASAKKKKKCKKKKPTPAPISMVRATLTWSGGGDSTDYDLYAFDPSGSTGRAGSDPIASTSFSSNAVGASGTETFTDLDFGQHRAFAFGVCKQAGSNDGSSYTIDYVTADAVHHTDTQSGHGDGYAAKYNGPPPPTEPNGFAPCPVP
jgi:hypothetical protein